MNISLNISTWKCMPFKCVHMTVFACEIRSLISKLLTHFIQSHPELVFIKPVYFGLPGLCYKIKVVSNAGEIEDAL